MVDLLQHPSLVRSVAVVGHLHHGKTTLMDMLLQTSHPHLRNQREQRYCDTRPDEQQRGLSLKTTPATTVLTNSRGKSFVFQLADTPGHVNFSDEVTAALRQADGVLLVVDAVEGVMVQTERLVRHVLQQQLPLVLFINKVDRLILELKLPPTDAFYKLRHTIDEVNALLKLYAPDKNLRLSPELGNVCFGSALTGWSFTVESFANLYAASHSGIDAKAFARRLWGEWYFHPDRRFRRSPPEGGGERSFVQFLLAPLYKLYAHVVSEEPAPLQQTLAEVGVHLRNEIRHLDSLPLLRLVLKQFLGGADGCVTMLSTLPSPLEGAARVSHLYSGPRAAPLTVALAEGSRAAPVVVHVTKLFPDPTGSFSAWGRIWAGELQAGMPLQVLGERFSLADPEDRAEATVGRLWIPGARYRVEVNAASVGTWVLIEGVDASIVKTATLTALENVAPHTFRPLQFNTLSVVKVAVEPINPSELPKMLEGLRKINKSYPLVTTKVEESGEHVILGTGEIYLDSVLHDLRKMYSEIEIKVADPVVSFCETVVETSALKCFAETPNKK